MQELKTLIEEFHYSNDLWIVMVPVILMSLDIFTGVINAWIKNEIKSSKLREGLGKKFGELSVILIGELFVIAFSLPILVASGFSFYIVIMELISICENLEKLGVPIPKFIRKALAEANENIQNGSDDKRKEDSKDGSEKDTKLESE